MTPDPAGSGRERQARCGSGNAGPAPTSQFVRDILKYVVDKGKSQITSKDKWLGENFYNRAIWNSVLIAEAIRTAQQDHRQETGPDGEDVRRGCRVAHIDIHAGPHEGRTRYGKALPRPFRLSCADHNGHGGISLVEWDGTQKWEY